MKPRTARRITTVFFALYVIGVTFPGFLPFNRIRPLIFGLPFSLVWVTAWVVIAGLVLWMLHGAETRARREG